MYELRFEFAWPSDYSSSGPWITDHSMESESPTELNLSQQAWASANLFIFIVDTSTVLHRIAPASSLRDTAAQEVATWSDTLKLCSTLIVNPTLLTALYVCDCEVTTSSSTLKSQQLDSED